MATMKVFGVSNFGDPAHTLEEVQVPVPEAKGRDIVVKIKSVATNPVDVKVLRNWGKNEGKAENPPRVVGWDASGVVHAVGDAVKMFKVGDEVYFAGNLFRQGCFGEYAVVDERIVALKPKSLNWDEAATVPLTYLTAWEGLLEGMNINEPHTEEERKRYASKTILVIGGAGGVGAAVLQLAKRVLGMRTVATASRPDSVEYSKKKGADIVINHREPLLPQLQAHGIKGVDVLYCTVDFDDYESQFVALMNPTGYIITITGHSATKPQDYRMKSIRWIAELMFTRSIHDWEQEKQHAILARVAELIDKKVIEHNQNPAQHFEGTLDGLKKALKLQESGGAIGKISLTISK